MAEITSFTGISYSHHLKMSVPYGCSTRQHSAKPSRRYSFQSDGSFPYFFAIHAESPILSRCGGSKTTCQKEPPLNGKARKSAITSGWTLQYLTAVPFPDFHIYSWLSSRLSTYNTSGCSRLNQNMRDPQQASRIILFIPLPPPLPSP